MASEIELLDSTLREGLQSNKIAMTLDQQKQVGAELDEMGIKYIEVDLLSGSWEKEPSIKENLRTHNAELVGFTSTRKKQTKAYESKGLISAIRSDIKYISIFGKSSAYQVEQVLETTREENLNMISESISFLKKNGKHVFFDAEHFFDGYKEDPAYALLTLKAAEDAGAELLVLCDTNCGTMFWEISHIIQEVKKAVKVNLGIHCHNDCGLALANSLVAYQEGVNHIQGTFLGNGERCGNAPLNCIIPILQLKLNVKCTENEELKKLVDKTNVIARLLNFKPDANAPFVGKNSFLHKAGTHINGVIKCVNAYEHIEPEVVGNKRKFAISDVSGKSLIKAQLVQLNVLSAEDAEKVDENVLQEIIDELKARVRGGYHYEEAQDSFKAFLCKRLGLYKSIIDILDVKIGFKDNREYITLLTKEQEYFVRVDENAENVLSGLLIVVKKVLGKRCPEIGKLNFVSCRIDNLESEEGKIAVYFSAEYNRKRYKTVSVKKSYIEACRDVIEETVWCLFQENADLTLNYVLT